MGLINLIGTAARIAALWDVTPIIDTLQGYNTPTHIGGDSHAVAEAKKRRGVDCRVVYFPERDEWVVFEK